MSLKDVSEKNIITRSFRNSYTFPVFTISQRRVPIAASIFMGTFGLPAGASATFQGNIFEGSVSGTFTTTSAGCSGSGSFSGTLSGSQLTISIPTVTTIDLDCSFCQQNTVVLTRTGP